MEAKKNDALRVSTFSTVVDGSSGRTLSHAEAYESDDGKWVTLVE